MLVFNWKFTLKRLLTLQKLFIFITLFGGIAVFVV